MSEGGTNAFEIHPSDAMMKDLRILARARRITPEEYVVETIKRHLAMEADDEIAENQADLARRTELKPPTNRG